MIQEQESATADRVGDAAGEAASRAAFDVQNALGDAWGKVVAWLEGLVESLPNIIAAIVVVFLFVVLARMVGKGVRKLVDRIADQPEVNRLVAATAQIAVIGLGLVLALGVLNLDKTVTSLLAGAGIIGLALGFAFQDIAENFIAGIFLNVRNQFREGDIIESGDFMGTVERVRLRATALRTFPGQRVLIPNAEVFKNPIINYTQAGRRRVDIPVGVAYGDDLEQARTIAAAAVEELSVVEPGRPVEVFYEGFGDSSINFQLRFWIRFGLQTEYLKARSDAIEAIKKAFDREGITIPFPIRTLDFDGGAVGGQGLSGAVREAGLSR